MLAPAHACCVPKNMVPCLILLFPFGLVYFISLLPAKPEGTLGLRSVRLLVRPSVRQYQFSGHFS